MKIELSNQRSKICWKCGIGAAMFVSLFLAIFFTTFAKNDENLVELNGYPFDVFYSSDNEERAENIAERCTNTIQFYEQKLGAKPEIQLFVLNPAEWQKYAGQVVYGMPHHSNGKLIVASEDNDFWRSFLPPVDNLPKDVAAKITAIYSAEDGSLTMQPFFDLLAIHELGHAFHFSSGLNMQRKWLTELFANLFLHTYIAEKEPELLPAATTFPEMVLSTTNKTNLRFTSLNDFENRYDEIAQKHPGNYGWYQCKLINGASELYNSHGVDAIKNLWAALETHDEDLNNHELSKMLAEDVNQQLADVFLKWDD